MNKPDVPMPPRLHQTGQVIIPPSLLLSGSSMSYPQTACCQRGERDAEGVFIPQLYGNGSDTKQVEAILERPTPSNGELCRHQPARGQD